MAVVVADIDAAAAGVVAAGITANGGRAIAVACDVTSRGSVNGLAERALAEFGAVHLLCNNAGVVRFRPVPEMTDGDWDWQIDVNLRGVVHGVQAFLPHMLARGRDAHIVNTGSIQGLVTGRGAGVTTYSMTKHAVVGLSENLRVELAPLGIGVSVVCPGPVRTDLAAGGARRPEAQGGALPVADDFHAMLNSNGMDPATVAQLVIKAVRADELYVLTHADTRAQVEARFSALMAAYDRLESGA
jgi:NAD(P)-dependent dehydrogenase (short-subunit alcohol dehydrogenase family)